MRDLINTLKKVIGRVKAFLIRIFTWPVWWYTIGSIICLPLIGFQIVDTWLGLSWPVVGVIGVMIQITRRQ